MSTLLIDQAQSYWDVNAHREVSDLWLMRPLEFYSVMVFLLASAKFFAPRLSTKVAKYDLRPWMLTYNGLLFGLAGVGFCIGMCLTNFGMDSFECDPIKPHNSTSHRLVSIKYCAYLYTLIKLMEFIRPILTSLRGKQGLSTSNGYLGYLVMQASVAYIGTLFHPGGVFCLWPLLDMFITILSYAYLILHVPGNNDFRPTTAFRRLIVGLRYASFLSLFLQGAYYSSFECGWPFLVIVQAIYHLLLVTVMTTQFLFASRTNQFKASNNNHIKSRLE